MYLYDGKPMHIFIVLYIFFWQDRVIPTPTQVFLHVGTRRDFMQQMPANVDVLFALLVYAFRCTMIYMLALNVGLHLQIAEFHTYALLNGLDAYCPQTRHHSDASSAKFIEFGFAQKLLIEFPSTNPRNLSSDSSDSSAWGLWQKRWAVGPQARSQLFS